MTTFQITLLALLIFFGGAAACLIVVIKTLRMTRWWKCVDCGQYFSDRGERTPFRPYSGTADNETEELGRCEVCASKLASPGKNDAAG